MKHEDEDENLWDDPLLRESDQVVTRTGAMTRFIHFFADATAVIVILYILLFATIYLSEQFGRRPLWLESPIVIRLSPFLLYLIYVWFMESFAGGRTLGKMLTGHVVVNDEGQPPQSGQVALRTLLRLIPIDPISVWFDPYGIMWHDRWSRTRVIPKRKKRQRVSTM